MDLIESTLKNFSFIDELNSILPDTKGFAYTRKGVIRATVKPPCHKCGQECIRNGWDELTRKDLFTLKIGKFYCHPCGLTVRSDLSFWERIIAEWETTLSNFFLRLADRDVAVRVISELMTFLVPMSKDSVLRRIFNAVAQLVIPKIESKYQIVHYDEQHPKKGRQQKYRLTLICAITKKVIADELVDEKNYETVKRFLVSNLDVTKDTIIITDDCPWYPGIFEDIWGKKVRHQLCILHLNKLVMKDCGEAPTLQEMYNAYLLLDIFFDRTKELMFIEMLLKEQETTQQTADWLKQARKRFHKFVRNLEKMRRREGQKLPIRSLQQATANYEKLQKESQLLQKPLQKRLRYIGKHWKQFTLFYEITDCPHTNNVIENYFSTSLKTHRKKQLRSDKGLTSKMKLSKYKRNIGFDKPMRSFIEWGRIFWILKS